MLILAACAGRYPPGAQPASGPIADTPEAAAMRNAEAMHHYDYLAALKAANNWLALAPTDAAAAIAVGAAACSLADLSNNDDNINAYIDRAVDALAPFIDKKIPTPKEQVAALEYTAAEALGLRARQRGSGAVLLLKTIYAHAQAAAAADPNFRDGAARRLMGLLMVKAPGWPAGPGDPDSGVKMLEEVTHQFPRVAEGYLLLAEAYLDESRVNEAATILALSKPLLGNNPRTRKLHEEVAERLRTNRGVKAYGF